MQREISNIAFQGKPTMPLDNIGLSSAIDRTASDYTDAGKICKNITGNYDADIMRHIPDVLKLVFQGMLEDIDTKEKVANASYKDMK